LINPLERLSFGAHVKKFPVQLFMIIFQLIYSN